MANAANPLAEERILQRMAEALPTREAADTSSDLSSSVEFIALFVHACMTLLDFRLLGFDEEKTIADECARLAPRLPAQWNSSFNNYRFVYAHSQSAMRYVVRVQRLSARVQVTGLAVGDERIRSFDVDAKHYVNNGSLPVRIKTSAAAPGETREGGETTTTTTTTAGESTSAAATEDRSTLANDIRQCFKGGAQIEELAGLMKTNIVQPLMPGLHKEGYEETGPSQEEPPRRTPGAVPRPQEPPPLEPGARPPERPEPYPVYDPLAAGPSRPPLPQGDLVPPGFEDEYEIQGSLRDRRGPPRHPPTGPGTAGIGYDDLYPAGLGPHDPLRPQIGIGGSPLRGGLPFGPFGGGGESRRPPSGMHPTFTDPLFGAGGAGGRGAPGAEGGGAFGPQRPEGSRWDPVMPPAGGPRPGPGPGRRGGGMAGDPSNPFSQFPPDAFM